MATYWGKRGVGSTARKDPNIPDSVFLLVTGSGENKKRRFPWKRKRGGEWKPHRATLLNARQFAARYGYIGVFNKTSRYLNEYFPQEGGWSTWAKHQREKKG